jgi:hypothetical protein
MPTRLGKTRRIARTSLAMQTRQRIVQELPVNYCLDKDRAAAKVALALWKKEKKRKSKVAKPTTGFNLTTLAGHLGFVLKYKILLPVK